MSFLFCLLLILTFVIYSIFIYLALPALYRYNKCLSLVLVIPVLPIVMYILFPVVYRHSHSIRRSLLFCHWIPSTFKNLKDPRQFGLQTAKNFTITVDGGKIEGWHVYPKKYFQEYFGTPECSFEFDRRPIIIYFHGAVGDRGGYNRVCFYRVLSESQVDAHVIVPDYRGFGDSKFDGKSYPSSIPSLETVISDIQNTLQWVASKIPDPNRIVVWSHSLSTAFICRAVCQVGLNPGLLILQAAVCDLRKAFHSHFLTQVYRRLPERIYRRIMEGLFQNDSFHLSNPTKHIDQIGCRIIFIHSEEDKIVPYTLGLKLYMHALDSWTSDKPVPRMCIFSASEDLGHSRLHLFSPLAKLISRWISHPSSIDRDPVFLPLYKNRELKYLSRISTPKVAPIHDWTDSIP